MEPKPFALELTGVRKRFGVRTAVDDVSLAIAGGRRVALIGPSGCGKSTVLRLVAGLIEPDAGTIRFAGEVAAPARAAGWRRRMGYVIQDGGLFPHLTAAGNVSLQLRDVGWSAERIAARLRDLCERARFPAELLGRYPAELSGGQRQRVGLMRALALDPELLLLDEPLGALDPLVRSALQEELRELFDRTQQTVLFVTHDLPEAAFFAHEIVLLDQGRIVQRGTWADLAERPATPFVVEFVRAQRGVHGGVAR